MSAPTREGRWAGTPSSLSLLPAPHPRSGLETADIQTALGFFEQTHPYCPCIYLSWMVMFRGEQCIVYKLCVCSLFTVCGSSDDKGVHNFSDETEVDITDEGK